MLNTAYLSDALDVALVDALNDARRDDSAGVIGSKQGTNQDTVQEKITAGIPEFCVVPRRRYYSAIRQNVIPIAIALFHKIDILLIMMETITRDS